MVRDVSLKIYYINPKYQAALEEAGVLKDAAILAWDHGRQIVVKNWADVFYAKMDGIGAVYVKRYFPQRNRLFGAFRNQLGLREYRSSAVMAQLGIAQPEPVLAAAVRNRLGQPVCGIYIMREVENAVSLDKILERMQDAPDQALLEAIADRLIELLDRMHGGNFCHWDLKPRNLLVTQTADGPVLTPIDSRSGRRMNPLNRRAYIARDYRFLLREPMLEPFLVRF
jgi:hypothetical protein